MFLNLAFPFLLATVASGRVVFGGEDSHHFYSSASGSSRVSIVNGECRVQDGFVHDGSTKRPLTLEDKAALNEYFLAMVKWQQSSSGMFGQMQRMFSHQQKLLARMITGFYGGEVEEPELELETMPTMRMKAMPEMPCLCRNSGCSSSNSNAAASSGSGTVTMGERHAGTRRPPSTTRMYSSTRSGSYGPVGTGGSFSSHNSYVYRPSATKKYAITPYYGASAATVPVATYRSPVATVPVDPYRSPIATGVVVPAASYPTTSGLAYPTGTVAYRDPLTGGLHQQTSYSGPGYSGASHTYSYGNPAVAQSEMMKTNSMISQMQDEMGSGGFFDD